ncbi:MAG: hypothetical protein ACREYF_18135 [Gammaproteobacteria bacterium]
MPLAICRAGGTRVQDSRIAICGPTKKVLRTVMYDLPRSRLLFRMGAGLLAEKQVRFSYALLALWPINPQNNAKAESRLESIAEHPRFVA